jgi:tRNA A-37 threonylcarbamoyl transferase component Bud32
MLRFRRLSNKALKEVIQSCPLGLDFTEEINISFLRRTRNSLLYLASSTVLPSTLLIKQVLTNDAEAQYNALVSATEKMVEATYRVPRPMAYIPQKSVIVMEYVNSKSLENILLQKDISVSSKCEYIQRSAQWLSSFHKAYRKGSQAVDSKKKIADLSNTLSVAASSLSKYSELASVWRWLDSTASHIQTHKTAFGYTHGDFKQENVLYLERSVIGIDLLLEEKGEQVMDLVQYSNHLLFLTMTRKGKSYNKYVNEWIHCFLDSYTENQTMIDMEVFSWFRLQHLMRYWSFEISRRSPLSLIQANKLRREISTIYHTL